MKATTDKQAAPKLAGVLRDIAETMRRNNDASTAGQLDRLAEKLAESQLALAFCGHFSAGKSSLINRLCGADLLPSGPVPTSANVVWVRHGGPGAVITRKSSAKSAADAQARERISLEQLAESCRNGDAISSVEIHSPIPWLGGNAALMDTPGIDSTDEEHLRATLATLSFSDCIFYVMDYNHVQSDTNFLFIKQLMDWGKPLYLLVNQIDKHNPAELDFAEYRASIKDAFENWQINPAGILYLSLKQPDHPDNEWQKFGWLLEQLVANREALLPASVCASARRLIHKHGEYAAELQEAKKAELAEIVGLDSPMSEAIRQLTAEVEQLKQKANMLVDQQEQLAENCLRELRRTIENANIMPASLRECSALYLQGIAPSFKTGWLFAKNKTLKETNRRTTNLVTMLQQQIDVELTRHVTALLQRFAAENGISDAQISERINSIKLHATAEWLHSQVQSGAVAGREYVMNFSRQVADEVKAAARKKAQDIFMILQERFVARNESELAGVHAVIEQTQARADAANQLLALEREAQQYEDALLQQFDQMNCIAAPDVPDPARAAHSSGEFWRELLGRGFPEKPAAAVAELPHAHADAGLSIHFVPDKPEMRRNEDAASQIREAVRLLEKVPYMGVFSRVLAEKAERMERRTYTAALFGAFSAGKSSFANALLGQAVLPVSPNPTTAALCKMLPATAEFPHGTARVKKKSRESMLADIRYSLSALGIALTEGEHPLEAFRTLDLAAVGVKGKPHAAFLQAAERGWAAAEMEWSQELLTDLPGFQQFAAQEHKSCFVESIELYLESPLAKAGIALVDTPGADSIHARHTGVAFEYIKNADIIIYVTYYNHAFSRADQQFLQQLGSVKDSFQLDKMFFVVNAADLAADSAELQDVLDHVRGNLAEHGVREPRIIPVSSKLGLAGKNAGDSGKLHASNLDAFEREFFGFCRDELAGMAVASAHADMAKAIAALNERIGAAETGMREKERRKETLHRSLAAVKTWLAERSLEGQIREIAQEIDTLLHYIIQRMRYRFGEFYNEAFHPAQLSGSADKKTALRVAWNELHRTLSQQCARELLTASLRVETYAESLCAAAFTAAVEHVRSQLGAFAAADFQRASYPTPEISGEIIVDVDERMLLRHFKNAKTFFEENGKQILREHLETAMMAAAQQYVQHCAAGFKDMFAAQVRRRMEAIYRDLSAAAEEQTAGIVAAGESGTELAAWKRISEQLEMFIHEPGAIQLI